MSFEAVIFDLGGVVLGSPLQAFASYEHSAGLPHNFLNRLIVAAGPQGAWSRLERGELDMPGFIEAFDREVALAGRRISAAELMAQVAAGSGIRPQMLDAVGRIRAAGLRTAALTNNWASADQASKMQQLRPHFDVFVESVRLGMRKPDPRIYQYVLAELGVGPSEAVFLDDIGQNLKPARALGMATLKVVDPERTLSELGDLLGLRLLA